MTEKRFELSKSDIKDFRIYDYGKEDAYFIGCDEHTGICLVSLLNQLNEENEQLKFENNELKCALALDDVDYIIADGKKIDIPPYYEFEQRYDSVMHRREYDGYD